MAYLEQEKMNSILQSHAVHLKYMYSLMKGVAFGWTGLITNEGDLELLHLDIQHKIIQFLFGVLTLNDFFFLKKTRPLNILQIFYL